MSNPSYPYESPAPPQGPVPAYPGAPSAGQPVYSSRSKVVAGILGILLGAFGAHLFYIGKTGLAVVFLLVTLLSFGFLAFIPGIIGLIQGILYLVQDTHTDANGLLLRP